MHIQNAYSASAVRLAVRERVELAMSDEPRRVEKVVEKEVEEGVARQRTPGKGPLILAKVIVSYLNQKKQVREDSKSS